MRTPTTPRVRLFALLLALALVALACGGDDDDSVSTGGGDGDASAAGAEPDDNAGEPAGPDTDLFGTDEWQLTAGSVDGTDLALINTHPITLRIDGDEVAGTAACNSYFGARTNGATLFEGFGATEMACDPPESMDLEFAFLDALGRVTDATTSGDDVVLTGPDVELTFTLVTPTADVDLEAGTWLLDTLVDGVSASSVMANTEPTISFDDGQIAATDGCNLSSGSYELEGDVLVLGALRTTTRGCPDEVMNQAQAFASVLGSSPTVSIEGDRLTLTAPDGRALVFRPA